MGHRVKPRRRGGLTCGARIYMLTSLLAAFIGIVLMIFVIAFLASKEDNYIHPWDLEEDFDLNTEDDDLGQDEQAADDEYFRSGTRYPGQ